MADRCSLAGRVGAELDPWGSAYVEIVAEGTVEAIQYRDRGRSARIAATGYCADQPMGSLS